ncbi:MAG: hypothetical protein GKS00_07875 [Alphaproteobacteria bacterium]|nr:hypothetical protein [Alphaproteobacteria bacterium]
MTRTSRLTSLAAAFGLSACAVLRVDVDVYKGPLANAEQVQVQELTSMAIGAKPLLIQLRDTIQWGPSDEYDHTKSIYGYIKECPNDKNRKLTKFHAIRINEILGLYKDEKEVAHCLQSGLSKNESIAQISEGMSREETLLATQVEKLNTLTNTYENLRQTADFTTLFINYDTAPNASYIELRDLLMELWEQSVETLELVLTLNLENVEGLKISLIEQIARLTQSRSLEIVMYTKSVPDVISGTLRSHLERAATGGPSFWRGTNWNNAKYSLADNALKRVLTENPSSTLNLLKQANSWVRSNERVESDFFGHPLALEKLAKFPRRRFGIVRGPSFRIIRKEQSPQDTTQKSGIPTDSFALIEPDQAPGDFSSRIASTKFDQLGIADEPDAKEQRIDRVGGFNRGRLIWGLETLTEQYLASRWEKDIRKKYPIRVHKQIGEPKTWEDEQRVLTLALIRFAAKVLKIANNEELLNSVEKREEIETYILVLQAIGNSILVQADELLRKEEHRNDGRDLIAVRSELEGIKVGLGQKLLPEIRTDDIENSTNCISPNCTKIKQFDGRKIDKRKVLDRMIAALRYELIAATRAQGANNKLLTENVLKELQEFETQLSITGIRGAPVTEVETKNLLVDEKEASIPNAPEPKNQENAEAASSETNVGSNTQTNETPESENGEQEDTESPEKKDLPKSDRVRYLERALEIALEHRSGMVYIRPPSAYLRTSYAATGLQSDPRLSWENMLWEHMKRSVPFAGKYLANSGDKKRLDTLKEIDKQFWQNINSVRLAGSGITNFALVKDDIGNWYAKGFSADPEPIIRGAQSLALFSVGGNLNMNLLRQHNLERRKATDNLKDGEDIELAQLQEENKATAAQGGPDKAYRAIFDRAQERYFARTEADFSFLTTQVATSALPTRIRDAWRNTLPANDPSRDIALTVVQETNGDPKAIDGMTTALAAPSATCDLKKLSEDRENCLIRAKTQVHGLANALSQLDAAKKTRLSNLDKAHLAAQATTNHDSAKKLVSDMQAALASATAVHNEKTKDLTTWKQDLIDGKAGITPEVVNAAQSAVDAALIVKNQAETDLNAAAAAKARAAESLSAVQGKIAVLKSIVTNEIQSLIKTMLDRRRDAAEDFRETIQVAGEAAR